MVNAISATPQTQPAAPSTKTPAQKPAPAEPKSAATDSVQLSPAAQAMVAALQEARETPAQTSQEASHGDNQARRLLAREAAAKPAAK
jgi:hypothetical protein